MNIVLQRTIKSPIHCRGVGLHSGAKIAMVLRPAPRDSGIVFQRTDPQGAGAVVAATWRNAVDSALCTRIHNGEGISISTIEHLMAAFAGAEIDNIVVEIDGPEVPIMDGSAEPFVAAIDQAGIVTLPAPRRFIEVLRPIRVMRDAALGELRPNPRGFRLEVEIDFDNAMIGRQALTLELDSASFRREIARARTFGFMRDVAKLWSAGYALGATFDNTLVVTDNRILNQDGLRFADEFVRHKALDAIGDLALAGAPLLATYRSVRGGHKLNHAVVSALMADPTAWRLVEAATARRPRGHADVAAGLVAPVFGPDVS
jgi:UDP-3-O-[3-hydroxymyristoyl] N-acetylglucosamine deacetylase